MKNSISILKTATKVIVDSSVLPGTAMGAEILWLYCIRWKNQISMYTLALISLFSAIQIQMGEGTSSTRSTPKQENIT